MRMNFCPCLSDANYVCNQITNVIRVKLKVYDLVGSTQTALCGRSIVHRDCPVAMPLTKCLYSAGLLCCLAVV